MKNIFFNNWESIWRVLIIGISAYFSLVLMLRVYGKRTLSKMNAFDFIVTIALGSVLASILLSKTVALADGLTALLLLITLQYVITWLSARYEKFQNIIKSSPTLLLYNGNYLHSSIKKERVSKEEINAKLREQGVVDITNAYAVVLETDGTLSVLTKEAPADSTISSLSNVQKFPSKKERNQ